MRRLSRRVMLLRVFDEAVLFYPLYALRFQDAGLSVARVSSLFAIWSFTVVVLQVPFGAWADVADRRVLLAAGALLRAAGFTLWTVGHSYPAFAAGFVLWGTCGALSDGTLESLVHDQLAAIGRAERYLPVTGRAATGAMIAMVAATALAGPALLAGGYSLVGAGSVAACLGSAATAALLPAGTPRRRSSAPRSLRDAARGYLGTLRAGIGEILTDRSVRHATVLAAAVPALGAVDEYLGPLARAEHVPTAMVPALLLLPAAAMAAGAAWAAGWKRSSWLSASLGAAAVLLASGALVRHPAGMIAVAACLGLLESGRLATEARLQRHITGPARATVLSVAALGAEIGALVVYALSGAAALGLDTPAVIAALAVPIGLTALLASPRHPTCGVPSATGVPVGRGRPAADGTEHDHPAGGCLTG